MSSEGKKKADEAEEQKPLGPPKSVVREYFESFVVTLIMAIFGMTFILQAVTVPTGSMQNTILVGDYLLVNKFIFTPGGGSLPFLPQREIQRGDIIVFKYPGDKLHPESDRRRNPPIIPYQINYVKRVIGLPGETVEFKNDQVFINGNLLPEHRIIGNLISNDAALETEPYEEQTPDEKWSVYYGQDSLEEAKRGHLARQRSAEYEFGFANKTMVVPPNSFFVMQSFAIKNKDVLYVSTAPVTELQKFLNLVFSVVYPLLNAKTTFGF